MDTPLYERLGGQQGIAALVDEVIEAHLRNPVINARFLPLLEDPDRLELVKRHTREFLGSGAGGPEHYTGTDMRTVHGGMNVDEHELVAAIDDILGVLDKRGAEQRDKDEVLAMLYGLKGNVLHV